MKYLIGSFVDGELTKEEIKRINEDYEKGLCIGAVLGHGQIPDLINKGLNPDMIYVYVNWEESNWITPMKWFARSLLISPSLLWWSIREGAVETLIGEMAAVEVFKLRRLGVNKIYLDSVGTVNDKIDLIKLIIFLNSMIEQGTIDGYGLNMKSNLWFKVPDITSHILASKHSFVLQEGSANDDNAFTTLLIGVLRFKIPVEVVVSAYTSAGDRYWSNKVPEICELYDVAYFVNQKDVLYKIWEYNRGKGY